MEDKKVTKSIIAIPMRFPSFGFGAATVRTVFSPFPFAGDSLQIK
jgi:hypothetical protein